MIWRNDSDIGFSELTTLSFSLATAAAAGSTFRVRSDAPSFQETKMRKESMASLRCYDVLNDSDARRFVSSCSVDYHPWMVALQLYYRTYDHAPLRLMSEVEPIRN